MKISYIKETLWNGSDEDRYEVMKNIPDDLLSKEVFSILCDLLDHEDDKARFFALFFLIDKFSGLLSAPTSPLVDKVFSLLFDTHGPLIDRATWALSIMGDQGLDKLIQAYPSGSDQEKIQITYAIGRENFSHRTQDRLTILLAGLVSEYPPLRFTAMCEIMSNTPVGPWCREPIPGIDYARIYALIQPIAQEFATSNIDDQARFAKRYLRWIEEGS